MHSRNLLRRVALAAAATVPMAMAVPFTIQADDTPADAKSSAKPEIQATEKRAEQMFKELDKNGDGKLTADELPEDRRTFFDHLVRTGDKDKNGELTLAEFVEGLKPADRRPAPDSDRPTGTFVPIADPTQFFKRLDKNGDGKLELDELPEPLRERMRPIYERLGKTAVDRDDFAKVVERLRKEGGGLMAGERGRMDGRGPAFFRKLDKNGDGRLSKEEMQNVAQLFDELDANKDGYLDVRELFGPPPGSGDGTRVESNAAPPADKAGATETAAKPPAVNAKSPEKSAVPPALAAKGKGKKDGKGPLRRFDTNGDGKVSRDEAQGKLKKNFNKLDADGDGFLERDELRKALQELKPDKQDQAPKA